MRGRRGLWVLVGSHQHGQEKQIRLCTYLKEASIALLAAISSLRLAGETKQMFEMEVGAEGTDGTDVDARG